MKSMSTGWFLRLTSLVSDDDVVADVFLSAFPHGNLSPLVEIDVPGSRGPARVYGRAGSASSLEKLPSLELLQSAGSYWP